MNEIKSPENEVEQTDVGKRFEGEALEKLPRELGKNSSVDNLPDEIISSSCNEKTNEFWDNTLSSSNDIRYINDTGENLKKTVSDYIDDLKDNSEHSTTIKEELFDARDLEKLSPEEVAKKREEFDDLRTELKKQWEEEYGKQWPKYEEDIYSSNGKLIRKAGGDYDAHHIHPLAMGGKNEVSNITPLHADKHYDKQGVHSPQSPYSKLDKMLGGID